MDAHELVKVFWKEENRKELSLYAYMLMGNKDDALDLLSDLLIEIYENPKMQDALDPVPYFKTTLRNKAYNIMKKNSRVFHMPQICCQERNQSYITMWSGNMRIGARGRSGGIAF